MTREKAIEELELLKESAEPWNVPELIEAMNIAIKALTHDLRTETHDDDLIRRRDAIEAVVCHIWHMPNEAYRQFNCENIVREVVEDAIQRLPSRITEYKTFCGVPIEEAERIVQEHNAEPKTGECTGCKFIGLYDTEFPCANCVRKTKDYYCGARTRGEEE